MKHLQNVQRQQLSQAVATDPHTLHKFKAGFNECASEVGIVRRQPGGTTFTCSNGLFTSDPPRKLAYLLLLTWSRYAFDDGPNMLAIRTNALALLLPICR